MSEEEFSVVVVKRGETFHAMIQELKMVESGTDLVELYQRIQAKKEEVLARLHRAGVEEWISRPKPVLKKRPSFSRFALIAFLFMIPLASIAKPAGMILYRIADLMRGSPAQKIVALSEALQSMPAERKEELRQAIHQILIEIKPFSDEIASAWSERPLMDSDDPFQKTF